MRGRLLALAAALAVVCVAAVAGSSRAAGTHVARVAHGHIVLDGKPFFPIMQWLQCPSLFDREAALGINVFLGKGCADTSDLQEMEATQQAHALSVLPAPGAATGSSLLGWYFADEPDLKAIKPSVVADAYHVSRKRNPRLLNFLTLSPGFFSKRYPPSWMNGSRSPYRAYAQAADVVGTDIYPIYGFCRPDWIDWVAQAQRELVSIVGGRPTFQWIEAASTSGQYCSGRGIQPNELRAEVWMAITNGAKGIGYFTHSWSGSYSQFRVADDVQSEMRRTDSQLTALAPAVLGAPVHLVVSSPVHAVNAIARRAGGKTYVFAVNTAQEPVTSMFTLSGISAGSASVIGERRTVRLAAGRFRDRFDPLAVHLYRIG